ncbi:MAG TPA: Sua5/YciO/YrdC/YwlC family protein [Candidatus Moranbacteria bacterium]|nr:Sua5/YciO/YrdC/YwlC family protein [Candidatus Moranbacteria bacterium]
MQKNNLVNVLRQGGVVFLPTDTIPGFSCRAFNRLAIERIYQIKRRNARRPFIVLVANDKQIDELGLNLNKKEKELLGGCLGQPTSVIVELKNNEKKRDLFFLHRGTNHLAIRLIKENFLRQLILQVGPLVSTSVNREGELPILNNKIAKKVFSDEIDYYFKIDENGDKKPSILARVEENEVKLIRG